MEIGHACIPSNHNGNTDFTCAVASQFMCHRANLKIMFSKSMLRKLNSPQMLFIEDGEKLRPTQDIVALFVCLFEFYDCFTNKLKAKNEDRYYSMLQSTLEHLSITVTQPGKQDATKLLLLTLYAMILTTNQDWRKLNEVVKHLEKEVASTEESPIPQHLKRFCHGIFGYCKGMLYLLAPWFGGSENHQRYGEVRKDNFNMAMTSMEQLPDECGLAKQYFSVHILLAQAEMTWYINPSDVRVIRQAYDVCMTANRLAQQVLILEPL